MDKTAVKRAALAAAAVSLMLVLDACACRPLRVGMAEQTPPATVAQMEASLGWHGGQSIDHRADAGGDAR
jgi:hypothetical protein